MLFPIPRTSAVPADRKTSPNRSDHGTNPKPKSRTDQRGNFSNAWRISALVFLDERAVARHRSADCGLGGRVRPQIAWAKLRALRDGAAIATKKLWS
jgi:hypothetical protein